MKYSNATLVIAVAVSLLTACQSARQPAPRGPAAGWVMSSETEHEPEEAPSAESLKADLGPQVAHLVDVQARSLEDLEGPVAGSASSRFSSAASLDAPSDKPGWHLNAMITELGVSVSGFIGFLTTKGTPSFQLIWRRVAQPLESATSETLALSAEPTTQIQSDESELQLERKVAPAMNAMLRENPTLDEHGLRASLLGTAREFQRIAAALENTGDTTWAPSRIRLDFSIDASGKVTPVVSVGGEARLRLEWTRNPAKPHPLQAAQAIAHPARASELSGWAKGLPEFASMLVEDLQQVEAEGEKLERGGFWASQYRVGLGISKKGDIGIAKSTVTLVGHLYFARKSPPTSVAAATKTASRMALNSSYALVSAPGSVQLASQLRSEGTPLDESADDWTVRIDRKAFRKGLRKSMRMAGSFAELASGHDGTKWQLKEIRTGFELALGGKTALTKINVLGATEIAFKAR